MSRYAVAVSVLLAALPAGAQEHVVLTPSWRFAPAPIVLAPEPHHPPAIPSPAALAADDTLGRAPRWWMPVASALVPGSGQILMGQTRGVPYLAAEAFAVSQYLQSRREARSRRGDYRELARRVARARFGGPFPVGSFEYYERMEHFVASGEFDLNPGGELEPETDVLTYNGSVWLLARRTFWGDPDLPPPPGSPQHQQAIDFYLRRAVRPEFRWSWDGAELEQDHFRRTIRRSNDAFRQASQFLSVLLANHALSAVDAFITLRLESDAEHRRVGVRMSVPAPRLTY